ncbi:MAG: energy transducer TonB [Fimbriimonadaceae bacterium]|nr:energy transducer TonB [Chitinophagales bacterium]
MIQKPEVIVEENSYAVTDTTVFMMVEKMPEFPGGIETMYKWLAENIQYPDSARKNNIEGKVYAKFIVERNGSINEVTIMRGIGYGCDEEVINKLKQMPAWNPGLQQGKPVRTSYTLPVAFSLGEEKKNEDEKKQFQIVEQMPEFPGGEKALYEFLGKNVKYPKEAIKNGIECKVYIQFIVEKDGSISNAKIKRGVNELLDNEALRAINAMPKWKPGMQKGKTVRVTYTLPVQFKLNTAKESRKKNNK